MELCKRMGLWDKQGTIGENGVMGENGIMVAAEYYKREWNYGREWRTVVEAGEYGRARNRQSRSRAFKLPQCPKGIYKSGVQAKY